MEHEKLPGMPKMLMHVCCANCLLYPYDFLKDRYNITFYYYNPNIHPEDEYKKRLSEVIRVSEKLGVELVVGQYDTGRWFKLAGSFPDEPEGGKRCRICFSMRLRRTALYALRNNFDFFVTSLSVSPHKNAGIINAEGEKASSGLKIVYLPADFKKNDGFKKTMQMSRKHGIYRQNYCGCVYSMK